MCVLSVIVLLPGLSNQRQVEKSQAAFRDKNYVAATAAANKAIQAEPWSATAYAQRALAEGAAGNTELAAKDIATAQVKEPYNWRWPLVGLKLAVERGDSAEAVSELRKAKELRRFSPLFGEKRPAIR